MKSIYSYKGSQQFIRSSKPCDENSKQCDDQNSEQWDDKNSGRYHENSRQHDDENSAVTRKPDPRNKNSEIFGPS